MVISAISVDTGERRRLTTGSGPSGGDDNGDEYPSVSPDGRYLAFSRGRNYVREVYVMPLTPDARAGGEPVKVTDAHYAWLTGMAWAGSGRDVVYGAGSVYAQTLWRVSAFGKEKPRQLAYAAREAVLPAIAVKTSRLAYAWRLFNVNLWRLDLRTRERSVLIGSTYDSRQPQYSPDGGRIAFRSNRSGNQEIWTCHSDGSNCQQLTSFGGPECGTPRWSPDGRSIALDARPEGRSEVYVIAADGGAPRRLTSGGSFDNLQPSWSPDGRWIYFNSGRSGQEIWKTAAGGGQAVQLTQSGGQATLSSPDGKYIYYVKQPGNRLCRMPAEGGEDEQVVPRGLTNWASFGVTAKGVYFAAGGALEFLDLATGKLSTLAAVPTTWGLSVSPDDRYVIWGQTDRNTTDLMLVENFR